MLELANRGLVSKCFVALAQPNVKVLSLKLAQGWFTGCGFLPRRITQSDNYISHDL